MAKTKGGSKQSYVAKENRKKMVLKKETKKDMEQDYEIKKVKSAVKKLTAAIWGFVIQRFPDTNTALTIPTSTGGSATSQVGASGNVGCLVINHYTTVQTIGQAFVARSIKGHISINVTPQSAIPPVVVRVLTFVVKNPQSAGSTFLLPTWAEIFQQTTFDGAIPSQMIKGDIYAPKNMLNKNIVFLRDKIYQMGCYLDGNQAPTSVKVPLNIKIPKSLQTVKLQQTPNVGAVINNITQNALFTIIYCNTVSVTANEMPFVDSGFYKVVYSE